MNKKYSGLFKEFTFRSNVSIKNRVIMAPMTNYASDGNGFVTEEELAYYKERAGGVGAVITAVAYVIRNGKGFVNEISAESDDCIPSLAKLAKTIKDEGAKAILQIFHAGRMAPPEVLEGRESVSASAVAAPRPGLTTPRELTEEEIEEIIEAFGQAARRAIEAGFDGVEIHGANTYLIQQFFSPHSNRRTDKWGGSLEKRMAFPLAVIDRVKKTVAEHASSPFIVGYRISPEEMENPGITMEDTLQFVDRLADQELDYLHLSVQDFWKGSIRDEQDEKSRVLLVHEKVGDRVPIIGVGSIRTADDAAKAIETGVPLLAIGRELIIDPKWVQKIEADEEDSIQTVLKKDAKEELVIPDTLWENIMSIKGWFPIEGE